MKTLFKGIAAIVLLVCITTNLQANKKATIAVMPFIVDESRQIDLGKYTWRNISHNIFPSHFRFSN